MEHTLVFMEEIYLHIGIDHMINIPHITHIHMEEDIEWDMNSQHWAMGLIMNHITDYIMIHTFLIHIINNLVTLLIMTMHFIINLDIIEWMGMEVHIVQGIKI